MAVNQVKSMPKLLKVYSACVLLVCKNHSNCELNTELNKTKTKNLVRPFHYCSDFEKKFKVI